MAQRHVPAAPPLPPTTVLSDSSSESSMAQRRWPYGNTFCAHEGWSAGVGALVLLVHGHKRPVRHLPWRRLRLRGHVRRAAGCLRAAGSRAARSFGYDLASGRQVVHISAQ